MPTIEDYLRHGAPADLDAATLSELYHCEMSAYMDHLTEEHAEEHASH